MAEACNTLEVVEVMLLLLSDANLKTQQRSVVTGFTPNYCQCWRFAEGVSASQDFATKHQTTSTCE